jgi:diguanylate cyclase (GGDEF)-like protein
VLISIALLFGLRLKLEKTSVEAKMDFQQHWQAIVVEKDLPTVELLFRVLETHGFNLKWCFSKEQLFERCLEKMPDLLLIDPAFKDNSTGCDGYTVIKSLKQHLVLKEIPIILLLQKEKQEQEKWKTISLHYLDILEKPIDFNVLEIKMNKWTTYLTEQEKFKKAALSDPLTGLPNYLALERELIIKCSQAEIWEVKFCIFMLDIDRFTQYNTVYGHSFGDTLLQTLASYWKKLLRHSDMFFRYKMAWFGGILMDTTLENAYKTCERIRQTTYEANFPHKQGIDNRVTVSIGVTTYRPNDIPSTLLLRVGSFLMDAKKEGGNKVKAG